MNAFHIGINYHGRPAKEAELIPVINTVATRWARYAPNCWIVFSNETAQAIATRIRAHIHPDDSVLVSALNLSDSYGWLPKEIWDWIQTS